MTTYKRITLEDLSEQGILVNNEINNLTLKYNEVLDLSGKITDGRLFFKNFKGHIKAIGTTFIGGVDISKSEGVSFDFEGDTTKETIFEGVFSLTKTNVQWGVFTGSKFKDGFKINDCNFEQKVQFCNSTISDENHFLEHSEIINTTFNGLVDFTGCIFDARLHLHNVTFGSELEFVNVKTLSEDYDKENDSSLSIQKITCLQNSRLRFIGTDEAKLFNGDVTFSISHIEGVIIFEYARLINIFQKDKEKLEDLVNENKVLIGKGCEEFRHRTATYTAPYMGSLAKQLIEQIAHIYTNFFTIHHQKNLGVRVTGRTTESISYFYYSDDNFTKEEFNQALSDAQQAIYSVLRNDSSGQKIKNISLTNSFEDNSNLREYLHYAFESIKAQVNAGLAIGHIDGQKIASSILFELTGKQQTIGNIINIYMTPKYQIEKVIGPVGDGATVTTMNVQDNTHQAIINDFDKLGKELGILKNHLEKIAQTEAEFEAVDQIQLAEIASNSKQENKVLKHLKNAGIWVLETAKEIGVSVTAELINKQLGQP